MTDRLNAVNPFYQRVGKEYLARESAKRNQINVPEVTNQESVSKADLDISGFIYVPKINLYVGKGKFHSGKSWSECYKLLDKDNQRMLTLPEFLEFVKYLRDSKNPKYLELYENIFKVNNKSWRPEYFDSVFKLQSNQLYVNSSHLFESNGNLLPKSSLILDKDTLMQDKKISLDWMLDFNCTRQGLPRYDVLEGDLYYSHPQHEDNLVVALGALHNCPALICNWRSPNSPNSTAGVRPCFRPKEVKQ